MAHYPGPVHVVMYFWVIIKNQLVLWGHLLKWHSRLLVPKSSLRSSRDSLKITFSARHEMSEPASEFFVAAGIGRSQNRNYADF
jgi:hypothetical protein